MRVAYTASSLKLIGFPAEIFHALVNDSAAFRAWLDRSSSPAEFMDLLQPALKRRPHAEPDREVCDAFFKGECLLIPLVLFVDSRRIPILYGFGTLLPVSSVLRFSSR